MLRFAALILTGIIFSIILSPPCYAENPASKLGRGLANIVTGWLEIPIEIGRKTAEGGDVAGIFIAPVTGLLKAVGRTASGILDVGTFIIPLAAKGYGSLIQPELILGEL